MKTLKKVGLTMGGSTVAVLVIAFLIGRSPAFESVPDAAERLTAGSSDVVGSRIQPYRATYELGSHALGLRLSKSAMDVRVSDSKDGLEVVYDFEPDDPDVEDKMILDRETLAPIRRSFPGQSLTFRGTEMEAVVHRRDGTVDTMTMRYGDDVFEVSVLDLVAVAYQPALGDAFLVAWNNFADADRWLAEVRVRGKESIAGPGSDSFDTRVVDIRFPSGELRRLWLASRPPYKIRQRRFDRGRLVQSGWDLVAYEAGSR